MKAEQLIPHYLASHATLSLQGLGVFHYNGSPIKEDDAEKTIEFPENSIRFEYNPKAETEIAFIQYLVTHTGKIKSLAASDLESFLLNGKHFLNIGKPLFIKDIGVLLKNQTGKYEFTQGPQTHEIIDTDSPGQKQQQHRNPDDIDFSSPAPKRKINTQKKWIAIGILIILASAGIITGIYNYSKNNTTEWPATDSLHIQQQQDSMLQAHIADSINKIKMSDTMSFNVVLSSCTRLSEADSMLMSFSKKGIAANIDSSNKTQPFIFIHFNNNLSDTNRIKDSLAKLIKSSTLSIRRN